MSETILTEDDYKQVLKNFTEKNVQYISSNIIQNTGVVEGFMGDYFTLEITYLEENIEKVHQFFGKSLPTGSELGNYFAKKRKVYEKEIFFYDFFIKEFKRLGYDTSFAPNCYFCKENKLLIMENLLTQNYQLSEKNKLYNLTQIKAGLKSLALFHSSSVMYEEEMSKKYNKTYRLIEEYPDIFIENYLNPENDPYYSKDLYMLTVTAIEYVINNCKQYKNNFMSLLTTKNCLRGLHGDTKLRKAIGHGDLWYNNIFFKNNHCKIVDYQILRYAVPTLDVLLFIYLNSSKEFRKEHLQNLLDYYYVCFEDIVTKNGYDISKIMTRDEYKESLNFAETAAMFSTISIGKVVFLPQKYIQEFFKDTNEHWNSIFTRIFANAMENEKEVRKTIIDAVDDLYDSFYRENNNKLFL